MLACAAAGCRRHASPAPAPQGNLGAPVARATPSDAADASAAAPPRGTQIVLAYQSNLLAELEQCGCPVHPTGGLARRATMLDRARGQADAVLVLDAGDLLLAAVPPTATATAGAGQTPPDAGEVTRRAHLMLAALARMGVAAFTPGERDLALGPALLRRLLDEHRIPAVSANLYDRAGQRLFDADRLIDVAGVRIGVFGLTRAAPADAALWAGWRVEARDPIAAARAEVASLRARGAAVVVALVHAGAYADAQAILRAAPGIDWAVLGHSGMNFEMPDEVGTARALEAMTGGRDFGRLDLHVVGGDARRFADRGQRAQLLTILEDHQRQIGELREHAERQPPILQARTAERIARLEKAIDSDRALLAAQPAQIRGSWFENRIVPLDAEIPDHPAVAALVDAYNHESQRRDAHVKPTNSRP